MDWRLFCDTGRFHWNASFGKNKCRSSSSDKECPTEIQRARGQCYDGAATKAGEKTGVATQIKNINGKCLYAHCYGHASNLAVDDVIKSVQCITDSLDAVRKIGKLVKRSPQRNTDLDKIRTEARMSHVLCMHFARQDGLCKFIHEKRIKAANSNVT